MSAVTGGARADAAAELYERNSRRVFGYCLSRLGRREDAEDATQLTFLHAVRGLRRGVVPNAESAWLLAIARNVCLSRWASASRRNHLEAACDPVELERFASERDPRRDELIGLERALERLPEQQRRAVLLRDWRGLSYEEVAEQLGVTHAAVETLIFRGRAALAEHLKEQPSETRRRLHSLTELGSLLHAIKGAVTGAAAGAKLAAGVTAIVAVSGGGIALGVSTDDPAPRRADAVPQQAPPVAATGTRLAPPAKRSPARAAAVASARAASSPTAAPSRATPRPAVGTAAATEPSAPAPAPAAAPAAEQRPDVKAAAPLPTAPLATSEVAIPSVAVPPPSVSTPDDPIVDAPLLPPVELPSTEPVTVAIDPVVAVVEETVSSLPPLPAVPEPPPPTVPLPPLPPLPATPPLLP